MKSQKHIVVFSHGFGVHKDDHGLFPDIASSLAEIQSILFDYNEVDEIHNTVTVPPFSRQAEMLKNILAKARESAPEGVIDLICHSQGAIAAALVHSADTRKTILLAPPTDMGFERTLKRVQARPGTEINMEGISRISRSDGSTTLVPSVYWKERMNIQPLKLYDQLAQKTELIIIRADQDEVLGKTDFSKLANAKIIGLDGNHDFTGEARERLLITIAEYIKK